MEQYFAIIGETMEGYGEFEVEALGFKVCISHPTHRTHSTCSYIIVLARTTEPGEAPVCRVSRRMRKHDRRLGEDK